LLEKMADVGGNFVIGDGLKPEIIHRLLDDVAARYRPVVETFSACHWSQILHNGIFLDVLRRVWHTPRPHSPDIDHTEPEPCPC
jgi:hypothetical protein